VWAAAVWVAAVWVAAAWVAAAWVAAAWVAAVWAAAVWAAAVWAAAVWVAAAWVAVAVAWVAVAWVAGSIPARNNLFSFALHRTDPDRKTEQLHSSIVQVLYNHIDQNNHYYRFQSYLLKKLRRTHLYYYRIDNRDRVLRMLAQNQIHPVRLEPDFQ